ncbi:DUF896 domain-containing protein [Paenibacillus sp. S-38]|uniref:DUF896 domain-containing protein n=1 Tax=Paenibacillus sp. S-38 TaxID=3416710 RepID=UPI003CF9F99C
MTMIPFLDRINELSRKDRSEGLTAAEKAERTVLRQDYLRLIRGQVATTMLGISVVDAEGNDVTPSKLIEVKTRLNP